MVIKLEMCDLDCCSYMGGIRRNAILVSCCSQNDALLSVLLATFHACGWLCRWSQLWGKCLRWEWARLRLETRLRQWQWTIIHVFWQQFWLMQHQWLELGRQSCLRRYEIWCLLVFCSLFCYLFLCCFSFVFCCQQMLPLFVYLLYIFFGCTDVTFLNKCFFAHIFVHELLFRFS